MNKFYGRWKISEMELWDIDYIDLVEPGYFLFNENDQGRFVFGTVRGFIDCSYDLSTDRPRVEFSWEGDSDMDPANGRGWFEWHDGNRLQGRLYIHNSDDSWVKAERQDIREDEHDYDDEQDNEEFEGLEEDIEEQRELNATLLREFAGWLRRRGLSEKTIDRHVNNIEFYINHFLLYEEVIPPEDGADKIGLFLGFWFIRKAMWADKAEIKSNATSMKKFYQFMCACGLVEQADLDNLKSQIKDEMPEWLATMDRYDNPADEDPFNTWGL